MSTPQGWLRKLGLFALMSGLTAACTTATPPDASLEPTGDPTIASVRVTGSEENLSITVELATAVADPGISCTEGSVARAFTLKTDQPIDLREATVELHVSDTFGYPQHPQR